MLGCAVLKLSPLGADVGLLVFLGDGWIDMLVYFVGFNENGSEGFSVGGLAGARVGNIDGLKDELYVGLSDGSKVGRIVGLSLDGKVIESDGFIDGGIEEMGVVGSKDGTFEAFVVGGTVGKLDGSFVGSFDGECDVAGRTVGSFISIEGAALGCPCIICAEGTIWVGVGELDG